MLQFAVLSSERYVPTAVQSSPVWRKASASAQGNCVEAAFAGGVLVRDSKLREGPVLTFPTSGWTSFLTSPSATARRSG